MSVWGEMMTIDGDEPGVKKFLLLTGQHVVITCVQNWWRGATEGYALTVRLGYFYLGAPQVSRTGLGLVDVGWAGHLTTPASHLTILNYTLPPTGILINILQGWVQGPRIQPSHPPPSPRSCFSQ